MALWHFLQKKNVELIVDSLGINSELIQWRGINNIIKCDINGRIISLTCPKRWGNVNWLSSIRIYILDGSYGQKVYEWF